MNFLECEASMAQQDDNRFTLQPQRCFLQRWGEFTHGVDESEGDIPNTACTQARAMNEGFPDVFGEFIERFQNGTTDWIHGTGCPACAGARNSSLADPPSYNYTCDGGGNCGGSGLALPQPGHWSDYRPECDGHWNSTILSKAGHLMGREAGEGNVNYWGLPVTGIGEVNAGRVFYRVLTETLWSNSTFTEFRNAAYSACAYYYSGSTYSNCILAVAAMGYWTSDSNVGWDTYQSVSLSYFSVGGQARRWIFYKDTGSNNLYYRYRTCTIYGACSWSSPTVLDLTSAGPASTTYGGYLWICFRSVSGYNWCDRIDSNGNRIVGPDPAYTLVGTPALVNFDNALYLAYRKSDNGIYWRRYTTESGWSSEFSAGFSSYVPPVLASSSEDWTIGSTGLWVVYIRQSDARVCYRLFDPATNTWGAERLAAENDQSPVSISRPTARIFRGRLHIAIYYPSGDIWYMSCPTDNCPSQSNNWTRYVQQDGENMGMDMNLDAYGAMDGRLYLWHRVGDGSYSLSWRYKQSQ